MADGDGTTVDLRTVFVKGVSFDWDDKTFEGAFSNIGPLRKCFLLKGAGKHHKVQTQYWQEAASPTCPCRASPIDSMRYPSDIVRRASLQGCGFATFALKEDAKRAIDELNGKSMGGRTIQVRYRIYVLSQAHV